MKHVVALSGGKDSTALALRLRELNPDTEYRFVCTPTGDELPEMQAHWDRLDKMLGGLTMLNAKSLFDVIEAHKALPNFRMRFCTREIKIEPFFKYMETLPPGSVMYIGIRKDEEDRLGMQTDKDDKFSVEKPFLDWGWGIKDVVEYLNCKGVEIPGRTDCGACFYQRLGEWKDLLERYPDRYQQYVDLEERYGHTFRSPGRDTWPASLKDLRAELQSGRKIIARRHAGKDSASCPWCAK